MAKSKQQEMIMQLFVSSRKKGPQEVDVMMEKAMDKDTASLEAALFEFFTTFRVGIYGRNHLRKHIIEDTDGAIDIGSFKQLKGLFEAANEEATKNTDDSSEPPEDEGCDITESDILNESSLNESGIEIAEEDSSADPGDLKTEPEETVEEDSCAETESLKTEPEETKCKPLKGNYKWYPNSVTVQTSVP